MPIYRTVEPTLEPIDLEHAKTHLRVTDMSQDDEIARAITAATRHAENYLGRSMLTQTWRLTLTGFGDPEGGTDGDVIYLPRPRLASVSSVAYVDTDGNSQTWAASNYTVVTDAEPGFIELNFGESWPLTRTVREAVTITYIAGYTAAANVPDTWKQAILYLVAQWYENREITVAGTSVSAEIPQTFRDILQPDRMEIIS